MRAFLEPSRGLLGLLSRFEVTCLVAGTAFLVAAWPLAGRSPAASGVVVSIGVALLAAGSGSFVRGLQWRRMLSRHAIDPNATVYYERGDYARIVERVAQADQVDLLGISLMYVLEYLKDHPGEYAHRVRYTRILLPATQEICDGRDAAQGTQVGALWSAVTDSHRLLERIVNEYRASFAVRFFTIQPYLAITRVDDHVWASPYLTASGRSSPVIAVTRDRSPELYRAFTAHYNTLWRHSLTEPQR